MLNAAASGAGSSRGGDRLVRESTELLASVLGVVRHAAQRAPRRMLQDAGLARQSTASCEPLQYPRIVLRARPSGTIDRVQYS